MARMEEMDVVIRPEAGIKPLEVSGASTISPGASSIPSYLNKAKGIN